MTVAAALFCTVLIIVVDLTEDKSALTVTPDRSCNGFFNHFAATRILLLFLIGLAILFQMIIFFSKQCCGTGPSDARVSITLTLTKGLNTMLMNFRLLANVLGER